MQRTQNMKPQNMMDNQPKEEWENDFNKLKKYLVEMGYKLKE